MKRSEFIAQRQAYREYLKSDHWKRFRAGIFQARGRVCERCGESGNEIHHKTYERVGCERPEDVEVLCRSCHKAHHRIERIQRGKRIKRHNRPSLNARGVITMFPMSRLNELSREIGIRYKDLRDGLLCYDTAIMQEVSQRLNVHLTGPAGRRTKKKCTPIKRSGKGREELAEINAKAAERNRNKRTDKTVRR